jgi:hypothetical protein
VTVRHVVAAPNVDGDGYIVDPAAARHCVVRAGALLDLSGPVDPATHLNADFPDHELGDCIVAAGLERGSRVVRWADGRPALARPRPDYRTRRGPVDLDARRVAWLQVHQARRAVREVPDARR